MLRRWTWPIPVAALAVLCAGCHGGFAVHVQEDRPVRVRYVHHSHVCTHACHDHYYDGTGVILIGGGHRHSHDCGHHWDGKFWIVLGKSSPRHRAVHVCSRSCHHHYYDGARLVVIGGGHRHSRSCGHHWTGKHWVAARKGKTRPHAKSRPHKGDSRKARPGKKAQRKARPEKKARRKAQQGKKARREARPDKKDRRKARPDKEVRRKGQPDKKAKRKARSGKKTKGKARSGKKAKSKKEQDEKAQRKGKPDKKGLRKANPRKRP